MNAKGILSLLLATVIAGFSLASAAQVMPTRYAIADLSGPDGSINLNLTIPVNTVFDKEGSLYVMNLSSGGSGNTAKLYKIGPDNTATLYADLGAHLPADDSIRSFTIADNGDVLIASYSHGIIYRYTAGGAFSTVAGYKFTWTGPAPSDLNPMIDGDVTSARFASIGGIAVDSDGTIFVTDSNAIRMIKGGQVTTIAGFKKFAAGYGYVDGQGSAARFNNPIGIVVDSFHNLYVCDSSNNVIRKVTTDGTVTTVAGIAGTTGGYQDGAAIGQALFHLPWNLSIDTLGNLYVTDLDNARVRKIDLKAGVVTTVVTPVRPNSQFFFDDVFSGPGAVAVDKAYNLVVLDQVASTIGTNNPSWILKKASLITAPGDAQIVNLSARATTGSGEGTFIGGFVVKGTLPVCLRAIGPGAAPFGVPNLLANPKLELHNGAGAVTSSNNDWDGSQATIDIFNSVGAFGLPLGSKDAVLYLPSVSGANTMFVMAETGQDGTALAEIYNAGPGSNPNNRLANISARGIVQPGNPLIGGFVVSSSSGSNIQVLIRGLGPALKQFGVTTALSHPILTLYSGSTAIARNDTWGGDTNLQTTATKVGAFSLQSDSKDAVLFVTLAPGAYTAQVTAADGSTGTIAAVEIYEVQ
jgi:hypothetical protein